jgi:TonB family protein
LRRALDDFAAGRVRCHAVEVPASVALVDLKALDEIVPEPLTALLEPEQIQALQKPPPPEEAPTQPPPPPQPPASTQVVEVTRPDQEQAPDHARFVSEYDTRVDRETVARGSTEPMVERPGQRELRPVDQPREASIRELPEEPAAAPRPDGPDGPGGLAMRAPGSPETSRVPREARTPGTATGSEEPPSAGGIAARQGSGETYERARDAAESRPGEGGGGGGRPLVPNLRPTRDVLERVAGGGSVDMLEGVGEGEITALNSKQWKFATFFNRLKRQVAQSWNPGSVIAREDPTGKVYGTEDRSTHLQVSLEPGGAVIDIVIVKSSGVDALDREAIRAIRAAQPFPNPPAGLVDERSGRIVFPFGFHVQMGSRNSWRIFRYR